MAHWGSDTWCWVQAADKMDSRRSISCFASPAEGAALRASHSVDWCNTLAMSRFAEVPTQKSDRYTIRRTDSVSALIGAVLVLTSATHASILLAKGMPVRTRELFQPVARMFELLTG